jgi:ABC-type molybdate transport system substrate-binding protein
VTACLFLALLAGSVLLDACNPGNNGAGWGVGGYQGYASTNVLHARGGLVIQIPNTLEPALQELMPVWQKAHPQIPIAFSIAPAIKLGVHQNTFTTVDLLISDLDEVQFDAASQGVTQGPGVVFATATLDFVIPAANPGHITRLQDLARPGLSLVNVQWLSGVSHSVQAALERMMRVPAFSGSAIPCLSSYAACVYGNLIVTVNDGLDAGRYLVSHPTTDGAFMYHTDYLEVLRETNSRALVAIPIPRVFAPPQKMWCALSAFQIVNAANARLFQAFLLTPAAQAVFATYGYLLPIAG